MPGPLPETYWSHGSWRWAKVCAVVALLLITWLLAEAWEAEKLRSWMGWIALTLILWLSLHGLVKGPGSAKGRISAHIWLGILALFTGILHGGLALGWTVHSLGILLLLIAIISGGVGVWAYDSLPRHIAEAKDEAQVKTLERRLMGWRAVHLPVSLALLGVLAAHILSMAFYR
jgi:hypothetical protein